MDKFQKKSDELHALVSKELEDAELHPLLRVHFLNIKKDLEAMVTVVEQLKVEAISDETLEVNEAIAADWADPEKQVDPNVPHVFAKAQVAPAKADEA